MSKKQLSAIQGVEAACILFQLNSKTADILRLAENAGVPPVYRSDAEKGRLCAEWRAFVHAVVAAGLMQHAPNSVLAGYLKETGGLLHAAAEPDEPALSLSDFQAVQDAFVDGPFAAHMALFAHEQYAHCPALFCERLVHGSSPLDARTQARLAAVMALVISAIWDKLEEYEILADQSLPGN